MTKKHVVKFQVLFMLAMLFMPASSLLADKPNIVLFFIDDMGWKDWSGGGSDYFETPNVDGIAAEGMAFTQGYVNAANCAPSRCCILSGQYTPRNHFYKRDRLLEELLAWQSTIGAPIPKEPNGKRRNQ